MKKSPDPISDNEIAAVSEAGENALAPNGDVSCCSVVGSGL